MITATVTADDEVVVTAPAALPQTVDPSATVTRLSEARLERARARGEGLGRVLDQVAGARVLDFGGPGAQQQLTLRGGAPSQALVVVDGVPLRTPFARGFDVGLVHPELLDEVELVRGGQGATWGDGALTGVLALSTRTAGGDPYQAATLVGGSFGTARLSAIAVTEWLGAGVTYERSDGDFDYVSRLVGLPDEDRVRENNDAQRLSFSLGTGGDVGGGRLEVRGAGAFREAGVPGLESSPGESEVAREQTWHGRAHAAWTRRLGWGAGGELRVAAYGALLDLGYEDPALEVRSDVGFYSAGLDADLTLGLGDAHLLRVTLLGAGEGVRGQMNAADLDYPARGRFALGLGDEWALGPVLLYGALRLEVVGGQRVALLPRLGARWDLASRWSLAAAVGRALRTPTLDELYHPPEAGFTGNPELDSELAWEAELSARYRGEVVYGQVATFARSIERSILYLNRNAFVVRPENVGAARALGAELELGARGRLGPLRLGAEAQVSLLASELEDTGARMPTQPLWAFATSGVVGWGPVDVDTALRGVGPTFVNLRPNDENRVPTYARWDAGVRVAIGEHVILGAEVLNLLDRRTLASVNRFPLPGRAWFVSVRLRSGEAGPDDRGP